MKIRPIAGGEAGIPDLQSGKAQLADGNYVSFVLAQVAGQANGQPADFRVVAPAADIQPGTEAQQVADTDREALEKAMERYAGLQPVIADTMPYDSYPLNLAGTQLQRVSNAMFEFGLTPGLTKPYQMAGMAGS